MAEENLDSEPAESIPLPETAPSAAAAVPPAAGDAAETDTLKTPFAQGDVALSGMVSSVLRPQDERERERIEREVKRRQERLERQKNAKSSAYRKLLLWLLILALILGGASLAVKAPRQIKKIYRAVTAKTFAKKLKKARGLEVWGSNQLVFEDTFRLKLKSNPAADKTTLIIAGGVRRTIPGRLAAKDDQSLTWEFISDDLPGGRYTYKAFVKSTAANQLKELRGGFEIK
ncbi:MAG: hypothetical protein LBQ83_02340 [Candidatus Margulisbacteria bacterium]|jgi:hypothetical protein|nr:hypothetical protein [Candidatus Margulisiibacteriota bacterium]